MASTPPFANKALPKDAQVIIAMFKEMGITDYEPQVIPMLLEFVYRYVTTTLDDAKAYAQHAAKKTIDTEDIQLAVNMQLDKSFTTPPPRDLLMEMARIKNSVPLPPIKPHCGIRLPPDRYCMTACNFELRTNKKHVAPKHSGPFSMTPQMKQVKRPVQVSPRPQTMTLNPAAKPVIKFTPSLTPAESVQWKPLPPVSGTISMDVDDQVTNYIKRKHPEDD